MAVGKVYVEDNTVKVIDNMENAVEKVLLECAAELVSQTRRNSRVDTGKTKGSWKAFVTRTGSGFVAYIGSPDENAVWEEFGTGEYALEGKGRKGGWWYKNPKVKYTKTGKVRKGQREYIFTKGKKPTRAFWNAYQKLEQKTIKKIQAAIKKEYDQCQEINWNS